MIDLHLMTFKIRVNTAQIDYFSVRMIGRVSCQNYKIIPGECVATQYKLFIQNVCLQMRPKVKKAKEKCKIKWWRLKGDNAKVFSKNVV